MAGEDDPALPTLEEILTIHDRLEEVHDLTHTGTMTAAAWLALTEVQKYDDPYHQAAALLWHLIRTHVFEDANKRTAWTVAIQVLHRHGIDPALPEEEVGRVVRPHALLPSASSQRGSKPRKSTRTACRRSKHAST